MKTGILPDSKIYVAGHDTVLGSALCRKLAQMGYRNVVTKSRDELDLRNQAEVFSFFEEELPDYVFLANMELADQDHTSLPAELLYANLTSSINVIHAAYLFEVKKLLNISGVVHEYEWRSLEIDEPQDHREEGQRAAALAKVTATSLCAQYRRQYGCDFISVLFDQQAQEGWWAEQVRHNSRFGRVGQDVDAERQFMTKVVFTSAQRQEFLYVDDPVDACLFLMEHFSATGPVSVTSARRTTTVAPPTET